MITNQFRTSKGDRKAIEQEQTEYTESSLLPLPSLSPQFRLPPGRLSRETSSVNFG